MTDWTGVILFIILPVIAFVGIVMQDNKNKIPIRKSDGMNHCIYCGEVIPEGRQICYKCEIYYGR